MLYIVILFTFVTFYLAFYLFTGLILKKNLQVAIRLEKVSKENDKNQDAELNQPLFTRLIRPFLDDMSKLMIKITPKEIVKVYEKKVALAGNPFKISSRDWINIIVAFAFGLPTVSALIGYGLEMEIGKIFLMGISELCIGLIFPSLILNGRIKKRQKQMINALPDVLDLLTVSVEAGLGFDGALAKVIDKMPGALSSEFSVVLQEVKVGKVKKEALRDMSARVGVSDLTTFIGSIIQAEQLGVSIGNVLRIQSEQLRQRRRQRAQEKAMKAPVKMLIPMVLFIFPTIFSVLIGPVVVKMLHSFAK